MRSLATLYDQLVGPWADEAALDADLRHLTGYSEPWQNADLQAVRTTVYMNKVVLKDADGQLVKGPERPVALSPHQLMLAANEARQAESKAFADRQGRLMAEQQRKAGSAHRAELVAVIDARLRELGLFPDERQEA